MLLPCEVLGAAPAPQHTGAGNPVDHVPPDRCFSPAAGFGCHCATFLVCAFLTLLRASAAEDVRGALRVFMAGSVDFGSSHPSDLVAWV